MTNALRTAPRELISNPLQPAISDEHAEKLIALALATRCAYCLAIAQPGRVAAHPETGGTPGNRSAGGQGHEGLGVFTRCEACMVLACDERRSLPRRITPDIPNARGLHSR